MIYIGIDPGINGAVGIIDDTAEFPENERERVFDTPTTVILKTGKKDYCNLSMAMLLLPFKRHECLVFLESVHAMPGQGVTSMFNFGRGFGIWQGILAAHALPVELVSPQRWKKEMLGDLDKENKNNSRIKAMTLFPKMTGRLSRVKDDGRAEALLLAEYGRRLHLREGKA